MFVPLYKASLFQISPTGLSHFRFISPEHNTESRTACHPDTRITLQSAKPLSFRGQAGFIFTLNEYPNVLAAIAWLSDSPSATLSLFLHVTHL